MTGYTLNMKRRAMDGGSGNKVRRPVGLGLKKTKLIDGFYASAWLYIKFLLVWGIVLTADFMLEFRFEYLWPIWLLLRSTFDSFQYQGLAFSLLFLCVSLMSDVICYIFIPIQFLYFAASTYVWVQYVWHTERGVCLPTVSLWLLFVYIETSLRLRDVKCLPFHWDLCRPFAAHCIGYPMVTLGFGCKTYISYKLRLRRQTEIRKENDFYYNLLQQALPPPEQLSTIQTQDEAISSISSSSSTILSSSNTAIAAAATMVTSSNSQTLLQNNSKSSTSLNLDLNTKRPGSSAGSKADIADSSSSSFLASTIVNGHDGTTCNGHVGVCNGGGKEGNIKQQTTTNVDAMLLSLTATMDDMDDGGLGGSVRASKSGSIVSGGCGIPMSINDYRAEENIVNDSNAKVYKSSSKNGLQLVTNGNVVSKNNGLNNGNAVVSKDVAPATASAVSKSGSSSTAMKDSNGVAGSCRNNLSGKDSNTSTGTLTNKKANNTSNKDDAVIRLENELKRLRTDHQASRNSEQELRAQISALTSAERTIKAEVYQLRQDNESLQSKLHNLVTSRQQDKQAIATLERKLTEERKAKSSLDQQLAAVERNKKKQDELATARSAAAAATAATNRLECTDSCKSRKQELETEVKQANRALKQRLEQIEQLERELKMLRQYKDAQSESEALMSALMSMRDKNSHLEISLSAETRLKMDLFSALGDAKRQCEIQHGLLMQREAEVADLKTKVAEVMALVPSSSGFGSICTDSPPHFSAAFANSISLHRPFMGGCAAPARESPVLSPPSPPSGGELKSNLNPNASDYQPKLTSSSV